MYSQRVKRPGLIRLKPCERSETIQTQLLKDIFLTVRDSLLAYKLRSALTLLGVIIGVTVVVTVSSILTSLYASVARSIDT